MSHKTKAAMQGRQCHYQKLKQSQDTRVNAGGQSLSAPVISGTAPLARLRETTQKLGCLRCTALPHTQSPETSGELEQSAGCTAMQHTPEKSRSFDRHPDFGYRTYTKNAGQTPELEFAQPSGSSLAFLRWRRLISPRTAALINWPVLSPGSLNCSIPSISSWAILAVTDCDFEFFGPVAISKLHYNWCKTIYTKTRVLKVLTCKTPLIYLVSYTLLCSGAETAKPSSGGTLTGPLTKPLVEVTIMAELQHTQTRPEFTWLFLATPKHYPECAPVVLRFDADTEACARDAFPGWDLVFAAKIRAQAPCRVSFFDYATRRGWEFDSAASQEVLNG